jgi:hypothetical protein
MAARKPLFMSAEGFSEEMATSDSMTLGNLTMGGDIAMATFKITGLGDPTLAQDAATKAYVDSVAQGLTIKSPALAIGLANIAALTGLAETVDGVALDTDGMRVLLVGQSTASANGLWVVHSGAWTRPLDFAAGLHASDSFVFIEQGTLYADSGWVCTTDRPTDVVGTNSLAFVQFSSAGVITASTGAEKVGNDIRVKKGDGIEVTSNTGATNIDLDTTPGLALNGTSPNKKLSAKVLSTGGIEILSTGLAAKLNGTTLQSAAGGLSVKGLPALFEIATVAVGANVTAANLDTLVSGGSADALHSHSVGAATEAPKIENTLAVTEAIAVGDPVYFSTTNDRISQGDTIDAKAKIIGVARTAQSTVGNTVEVVTSGVASGVLSGATAGDAYYLATGGGLSTLTPGAGKRVIQMGIAKNGTDLFVRVVDYGKKAA